MALGLLRGARVHAARLALLGFALLVCAVGSLFAASAAPAASSKPPAGCTVTPCLLLAPAVGGGYVFTAWDSPSGPTFASMDLTLWTKGAPTDVRSSAGRCGAPVLGHYSQTATYYNVTCNIHAKRRLFQMCFKDGAGLEPLPTGQSNTAEFPEGGVLEAYAVQKVATATRCTV
jgi:hypothetical protein